MDEDERRALTAADFAAAGVEAPNWAADPIPSLETWRGWRAAEEKAFAHKQHGAPKEQAPPNTQTHDLHD